MAENAQNLDNTEKVAETAATEPKAEAAGEKTPEMILTEKLAHAEDKYKYLYADFENFKKRAIKERQDAMKFGWENVAEEMLGVLDNLERALQYAKPETDPNLLSGLKMVAQQFVTTLGKQGVAPIPTVDHPFNPDLHEAVGQMPSDKAAGTIIQEVQKGYTLHGRLLRASRVMLSSGPAAT